jgi:hypothetical protein
MGREAKHRSGGASSSWVVANARRYKVRKEFGRGYREWGGGLMEKLMRFLATKADLGSTNGFPVKFMPPQTFDFQRSLIEWSSHKGRAALFCDCGLGKTIMQLTFAENAIRHANKHALILTPLAVAPQTVHEGEKFGIECFRSRAGDLPSSASIVVTNYQQLHRFDQSDFCAVVCDESSILKNFNGSTKAAITEFMRTIPYRLLCTATAAPNDYDELGTSSEALGYLGYQDMLTRFFTKKRHGGFQAWGREDYQLRSYAEHDFWRWVVSWARAVRKPSDIGYSDDNFHLPKLITREHSIVASIARAGQLFDTPAYGTEEQREERRRTVKDRCEKAAELACEHDSSVMWCDLNDEGKALKSMVRGAEEVAGSDPDERKEEILSAFASGQLKYLVTKPKIAGFGLNWQHCAHQTFFPSHSFEQFYQGVRRCWRKGQKRDVTVDIITTEGSSGVLANMNRKAVQAEAMFANMVELMNNELNIDRSTVFSKRQEIPTWL